MIIITKHDVTDEELDHIRERVEAFGLQTHLSRGKHRTVVGCIGDEEVLAGVPLLSIPGVEAVHTVMKPYKLANLQFAAEPTRVPLGSIAVGDISVTVVAGPCSVEGLKMLSETAQRVQKAGAVRASRRCVQAAQFTLLLRRAGRRWAQDARRRPCRDRPPRRD